MDYRIKIGLLFTLIFCAEPTLLAQNTDKSKPNILFVFIDDMGFGDLGIYGNEEVHTPNIDNLAKEGLRINQFYVNSPICSPSRVAVTTGHFPSRWGITSFISNRKSNKERGIKNYLSEEAPSVAQNLKNAGYYTAHIGKWHMGGGRDIGKVPLITTYGFDESVTQFEGLGERYLATYETLKLEDSTRGLEKQSAALGRGEVHWRKRENFTQIFVDRTFDAIKNAREINKPFYINLWPDDIHTPLEPPRELGGDLSTKARFLGVIREMDKQMGRLFDYIKSDLALANNTLIIFTSDNGPAKNVNDAGHLKGHKTNLYEGGFREPFISWGPGVIPESKVGTTNPKTVVAGIDLPLLFMDVAGVTPDEHAQYDGEHLIHAILGRAEPLRKKPLFWIRPPDFKKAEKQDSPDLAIRKGDYKLLMNTDGTHVQLYNIVENETETENLAIEKTEKTSELKSELMKWYKDYPHTIDKKVYTN